MKPSKDCIFICFLYLLFFQVDKIKIALYIHAIKMALNLLMVNYPISHTYI